MNAFANTVSSNTVLITTTATRALVPFWPSIWANTRASPVSTSARRTLWSAALYRRFL